MVMRIFWLLLLTLQAANVSAKTVVVVLSEATELKLKDGKTYTTGNYLNELMIPLFKLMEAGHTPLFVTPTGKRPNLDKDSIHQKYFNNDPKFLKRAHDYFKSIRIEPLAGLKSRMDQVGGVFVPGGHAPLIDLTTDANLGALLRQAHQRGLPTGLICHGPIALLAALEKSQEFVRLVEAQKASEAQSLARDWIYKDYRMTIFSDDEEKIAESGKLKGPVTYYPLQALKSAGGVAVVKPAWTSHVVVDRELVTAQNPNSVEEFALALVKRLQ